MISDLSVKKSEFRNCFNSYHNRWKNENGSNKNKDKCLNMWRKVIFVVFNSYYNRINTEIDRKKNLYVLVKNTVKT